MDKKTYKYLITFTPMEPYFFGGERTFGFGKESDRKPPYYIVSEKIHRSRLCSERFGISFCPRIMRFLIRKMQQKQESLLARKASLFKKP